jgi:hypothetical protein
MPLSRTTSYCPICGAKLAGRLDKRFCSNACRALYFRSKSAQHMPVSRAIDAILHRNWKILSEYYHSTGKRKFFVEMAKLNKRGFHPNYYTTSSVNTEDKPYYYVYDFGWMTFSEKQIMVVKLEKPK